MAEEFGLASPPGPASQPARIQAPAEARSGARAALLVVMPGWMKGPGDFDALLDAIQGLSSDTLQLWVAVPHVDWQHIIGLGFDKPTAWVPYGDGLLLEAVEAACKEGFPLLGKPGGEQGHMKNVFVALHSAGACFYPGVPMKSCAGVILLGSVIDGVSCPSTPDVSAAPGPVMHVVGAIDGALRLPRAARVAAHIAPIADKLGPQLFARMRPFAVIPGMNHAQFCNGVTSPMDIPSVVPLEVQTEAVAGLISAFVAANHPDATEEGSSAEIAQLLEATFDAFDLLSPFLEAAGRGSPAVLLPRPPTCSSDAALAENEMRARSFGAEKLPLFAPDCNSSAHPGELAAAEGYARAAQWLMLVACMPPDADLASITVAVTAHTHLDTFVSSKPAVFRTRQRWVVHAHVYLHWECYQPGKESLFKPLSPQYMLKLKTGAAVAQAMGVSGSSDAVISGAELNKATFLEALQAAPELFKESFAARGKRLLFAPDRDMVADKCALMDWVTALPSLEPGAHSNEMVLTSPCMSSSLVASADGEPGCLYLKAMSPAWMHEWVMIEGLRH